MQLKQIKNPEKTKGQLANELLRYANQFLAGKTFGCKSLLIASNKFKKQSIVDAWGFDERAARRANQLWNSNSKID